MDLTPNQRLLRLIDGTANPAPLRRHVCCITCRYSYVTDYGSLQCRRYAPRPSDTETWDWPNVDASDWCGEWSTL
jgi:hypothetical protein